MLFPFAILVVIAGKGRQEGKNELTIYLDAVWALNFFLDFMLLLLTKAILRQNTKKRRILFGAFVASLIVPVTFYIPDSFFTSALGKLLYSIFIILCTFGFTSMYRLMKLVLTFYFTTFAIGGGLLAIHFVFQQPVGVSVAGVITVNSGYGDPISWLFVLIGFPIVWLFTKSRMDKHAAEKIRYDRLHSVTIQINDQPYSTKGFIDSGNQLVDPLTKKWVILCDATFLKQWFTETEWKALQAAYENLDFEKIPEKWEKNIQFVPYRGAGGDSKFLFTIRPDHLIVHYGEEEIMTKNIIIGIQFSSLVKDESYRCLLHPEIIKLSGIHSAS